MENTVLPTTETGAKGDLPVAAGNNLADSAFFGISIRAWLAFMLVLTICVLSGMKYEIQEPLYSMGTMALGFYLGQKNPGNVK